MRWEQPQRLVVVSSIIMDIMMYVDAWPPRGGDVIARAGRITPGGAFNVIEAAVRLGLPVTYGGLLGVGVFGQWIRQTLREKGVAIAHEDVNPQDQDTGFDVALVETGGERTFVTALGAESEWSLEHLEHINLEPGDAIYLSGYEFLSTTKAPDLAKWAQHVATSHLVLWDPGPLVMQIAPEIRQDLLNRSNICSANRGEAELLTGASDAFDSVRRLKRLMSEGAWAIVRDGSQGAYLCGADDKVVHIPTRQTKAIDTTGAGDVHQAALIAALAQGQSLPDAIWQANVAASLSVEREGPGQGPDYVQLRRTIKEF
ncbi:hypothetical protein BXT84_03460 [Sulfobacillus thermotolerans]|uniref:Carbohydrate kinase PfkB domain-containing protein n=1 Tax=Sulfobacillus thermotolerans TaxID=338644 RepID=A0ABM6RP07_9FIRM|nr:hypothetical protein BXT84_03460 [Sulfobacillus thermotolerans]